MCTLDDEDGGTAILDLGWVFEDDSMVARDRGMARHYGGFAVHGSFGR